MFWRIHELYNYHRRAPFCNLFEGKPAAGPGPILLLTNLLFCVVYLTWALEPPLFISRSTQMIVMLSEPIPSFCLISSKVSGQISSNSLWLHNYISLLFEPCIGNICLKYCITWSDVLQSHIPSQARIINSTSLCRGLITTSGKAVTIWLFKYQLGYASFGGGTGL